MVPPQNVVSCKFEERKEKKENQKREKKRKQRERKTERKMGMKEEKKLQKTAANFYKGGETKFASYDIPLK